MDRKRQSAAPAPRTTVRLRPIVVIGPSGSGKSTLGLALAQALERDFLEGDTLHPASNVAKMARGEPLTDADRVPFLENVGQRLVSHPEAMVASCSALRRSHRDRLRALVPDVLFVSPAVPPAELRRRVTTRKHDFMPASLLDSQIATFERPDADEQAIEVNGLLPVGEQVLSVVKRLRP